MRLKPVPTRVPGKSVDACEGYVAKVLGAQREHYGAPLNNHLLYAHRPGLFRAVRGMWAALDADGILGEALVALVNRRVAALNGCVF